MEIRLLTKEDAQALEVFYTQVGQVGTGQPSLAWLLRKLYQANEYFRISAVFSGNHIRAIHCGNTVQDYTHSKNVYKSWIVVWTCVSKGVSLSRKDLDKLTGVLADHFKALGLDVVYLTTKYTASSTSKERKAQAICKLYSIKSYDTEIIGVFHGPADSTATPLIRMMLFNTKKFPVVVLKLVSKGR